MDRFVVDPSTMLHLASTEMKVSPERELLAPTLFRSQVLSLVHEAVHRGEISAEVGRKRLARIDRTKLRLLGDAVLRRRAFDLSEKYGWASTYDAEYVALTQLQADALVTIDQDFARKVEGIVALAPIESLL